MKWLLLPMLFTAACQSTEYILVETKGKSKLPALSGVDLPPRKVKLYFQAGDQKTSSSRQYLKNGDLARLDKLWKLPPGEESPIEHINHYAIYLALQDKPLQAKKTLQHRFQKLTKDYHFENIDSFTLLQQNR